MAFTKVSIYKASEVHILYVLSSFVERKRGCMNASHESTASNSHIRQLILCIKMEINFLK